MTVSNHGLGRKACPCVSTSGAGSCRKRVVGEIGAIVLDIFDERTICIANEHVAPARHAPDIADDARTGRWEIGNISFDILDQECHSRFSKWFL